MNHQEIFDKVASHLLTQKRISSHPNSLICKYHGQNNLKCAVGCLISNKQYSPELEGSSVSSLIAERQELIKRLNLSDIINVENENLLTNLQKIHDEFNVEEWKDNLKQTAKDFNLNDKILDSFNI